jgi:hypothetical protein
MFGGCMRLFCVQVESVNNWTLENTGERVTSLLKGKLGINNLFLYKIRGPREHDNENSIGSERL